MKISAYGQAASVFALAVAPPHMLRTHLRPIMAMSAFRKSSSPRKKKSRSTPCRFRSRQPRNRLTEQGVTDVSDLVKVVPGFNFTESAYATPVYTLRGIGFYDTSLAAKPTVSIYQDQVALPFSIMTRGATLDLERVEVLKGPQGTLFGSNATGGAINYIAAKPTATFKAGFDAGVNNFGEFRAAVF
jgi:outer membrane receptor protein involved in Fe transport